MTEKHHQIKTFHKVCIVPGLSRQQEIVLLQWNTVITVFVHVKCSNIRQSHRAKMCELQGSSLYKEILFSLKRLQCLVFIICNTKILLLTLAIRSVGIFKTDVYIYKVLVSIST